jgi:signal transduction histidine kinase
MRTEQSFTANGMPGRAGMRVRRRTDDGHGSSANVAAEYEGLAARTGLKRQGLLHDARNLLAAIELYCDLLSMPDVLRAEHRKYPEELRLLGRRSSDLLSQLMDAGTNCAQEMTVSREQYQGRHQGRPSRQNPISRVEVSKGPVSLRQTVGASAGLLSRVAEGCTVEFCYGPAASLPIGADVESVERILLNLVHNAARATQISHDDIEGDAVFRANERRRGAVRKPRRIRVTVGQLPDEGQGPSPWPFQRVGLVVEDNGCGMAARQVQRLLHGTDGPPGRTHGIGFRVVRELVEQSNGELHLMSMPGAGTRVQIEWPVWVAPDGEMEPTPLRRTGDAEFAQARTTAAGIIAGGMRERLPVQLESQQEVS